MDSRAQITDTALKIDALGLWGKIPGLWALLPHGTVFPYFCVAEELKGHPLLKAHILFLEGWQNLRDYNCWRRDHNYGFISNPVELTAFDVMIGRDGTVQTARTSPGFAPDFEPGDKALALVSRLVWETYGVIMRCEGDTQVLGKYASEGALFARRELSPRKWEDAPLALVPPRPLVEKIVVSKDECAAVKDLPFIREMAVELRFGPNLGHITQEPHPRIAYELECRNAKDGKLLFCRTAVVRPPSTGIADLWQDLAPRVLKELAELKFVPGEIRVRTLREFRILRILTLELPFKLSLRDQLEHIRY